VASQPASDIQNDENKNSYERDDSSDTSDIIEGQHSNDVQPKPEKDTESLSKHLRVISIIKNIEREFNPECGLDYFIESKNQSFISLEDKYMKLLENSYQNDQNIKNLK